MTKEKAVSIYREKYTSEIKLHQELLADARKYKDFERIAIYKAIINANYIFLHKKINPDYLVDKYYFEKYDWYF